MRPEEERRGGPARIIRQRYMESARRLSASLPAETITLHEASAGRLAVKLHGGDVHEMDPGEVRELLSLVPPYFWKLMRIPVLLRYEKPGGGPGRYVVVGGPWQRRLVEIMLRGDYSEEGLREISVSDFQRLVSRFRSIVFVSLSL